MSSLAKCVVVVVAALGAVACGSTTTTPSAQPATAAATPTPNPTPSGPTGPPKAQVVLTGDRSVAGPMKIDTIECSYPSLAGEQIFITGTPSNPATSIHLTLTAGAVAIVADAGSGSSFRARQFSGTGVTGFDAGSGAQLSGTLTETTSNAADGVGVGKITAISGSIDCAGQTPGSSTITISGTLSQGTASGGLTDVKVACLANDEVETYGIGQVGGSPNLIIVFALPGRFTLDVIPAPGQAEFFTSTATATDTPSTTGATLSGDALQQVSAGTTATTIHLSGTSTCGSGITP